MPNQIFAAAVLFVFCSCTGLKKSQVEATENFAIATKGISKVPSDIYFRIYQLKSESQTLQLNTLLATNDNSKESIRLLKDDYAEKMRFIQIAEEYSTSYQIVEQYASLVLCLLNESYRKEFSKRKSSWQSSFDGLIRKHNNVSPSKIPSSVSNLTSRIIFQVAKLPIAQLQKKYLKEAIHTARIPFENICEDYIMLDSLKIRSELNDLPSYLDNNYANFLENVRSYEKQGNNPFHYYRDYSPLYANWLSRVNELNVLSANTVKAFRILKIAYGKLEEYVDHEGKGPLPDEILRLMDEYGSLVETYKKFQYQREKLNAGSLVN